MNKKNGWVIFLIVWFVWAAGRDLDLLARFSTTSDYYIFSNVGLTPLFFVLAGAVFLVNVVSVWYLFRPAPGGHLALLGALGASLIYNVVAFVFAYGDLAGVKAAYVIGREARGLPVRPETLEKVFAPEMMMLMVAGTFIFYIFLVWVVFKNKGYFTVEGNNQA